MKVILLHSIFLLFFIPNVHSFHPNIVFILFTPYSYPQYLSHFLLSHSHSYSVIQTKPKFSSPIRSSKLPSSPCLSMPLLLDFLLISLFLGPNFHGKSLQMF